MPPGGSEQGGVGGKARIAECFRLWTLHSALLVAQAACGFAAEMGKHKIH